MIKIRLNKYPQYEQQTFAIILPTNQKHEVGEKVMLIDYFSTEFICIRHIISKETLRLAELNDCHTFLAKNCDADLFKTIIKETFKKYNADGILDYNIDENSLMDFLVLTEKSNIRQMFNPKAIPDFDVKKSLCSKNQTISKNYKFKPSKTSC